MVTVHVCIGSACHLKGAYNVIQGLQRIIAERKLEALVEIKAAFCLGHCTNAVSVRVNDEEVLTVHEDNVGLFFDEIVMGRLSI